jgi:hypothetical protein
MPDLVDKFFREDLTEAEQEALSQELLNSDKAALKFESKAKALYISFGLALPRHHWVPQGKLPWHAAPAHSGGHALGLLHHLVHVSHLSHWIWPSLFVVGVTGSVVTWNHFEKAAPPVEIPKISATPTPAAPKANSKVLPVLGAAEPAARVTPVALNPGTPPAFSSLSIEVAQTREGPISVQVLDMSGHEVISLYQGGLKAGDWVFEWDGKLTDGSPAQAGFYRIEVQSGAFIQRKNIQIQ